MVDHRDTLISNDVVAEPVQVRSILAEGADDFLRSGQARPGDLYIVRLVVPVAPCDAFGWLREQELFPRIFWHGRKDDLVTAAVGVADRCFGGIGADYDDLRAQLDLVLPKSDTAVRYFGGFRFDRSVSAGEEWEPYGTFHFILPRFEYLQRRDRAILACNLLLPRDAARRDQIHDEIAGIRTPALPLDTPLEAPEERTDRPDAKGWRENVERALDAFRTTDLDKVVLARRSDFGFRKPLDPLVLLKRLKKSTSNCFHFGFQLEENTAFLGATPERLFRRSARRIWTEAVAGTRPRGETRADDERLVASLLESDKDQREHAYVRESIAASLRPLCDRFYIDPVASTMKLARGWHLLSSSRGTLSPNVHGSEVMRALHPTPAVGGVPTGAAMDAIRAWEPFDRGWYAGPVGWIGSHGAEFAVALRCGLVRNETLSLYSGAGIVDGSNPDAEWAEIEQKISDFVRIFGPTPSPAA